MEFGRGTELLESMYKHEHRVGCVVEQATLAMLQSRRKISGQVSLLTDPLLKLSTRSQCEPWRGGWAVWDPAKLRGCRHRV